MTFLHNAPEKFKELIEEASTDLKINPAFLENEYYVTMFLNQLSKIDNSIIFKGGTSISLCYGAIKRFSEDIDLNYNNGRMHPTTNMRREFNHSITRSGDEVGLTLINEDKIRSKRDYNLYQYDYPHLFTNDTLKQNVIVETSVRSPSFPAEERPVEPMLGKFLRDKGHEDLAKAVGLLGFTMKAQSLERTVTDKIFAVGDYFFTDKLNRQSRHIYDLYKLFPLIDVTSEKYKKLFSDVLLVRETQPNNITAAPEHNLIEILKKVIDTDFYKDDYNNVTRFLFHPGEDVSYEDAKENLSAIVEKLETLKIYSEARENQLEGNKQFKEYADTLIKLYEEKEKLSAAPTEDSSLDDVFLELKERSKRHSALREEIIQVIQDMKNNDVNPARIYPLLPEKLIQPVSKDFQSSIGEKSEKIR